MKKFIILLLLLIPIISGAQIIGTTAPNVMGGNIILDSGPRWFYEQDAAPSPLSDRAVCYAKENPLTGKTGLYCEDEDGVEYLIMPGGGILPGAVQWVGVTTLTYDGDGLVAYAGADAQCVTDTGDAQARVCTNEELVALVQQGSTFGGLTDEVWVNGGSPGYTANANDCKAWTEDGAGYYGRYWKLADKAGWLSGCASAYKFACCK